MLPSSHLPILPIMNTASPITAMRPWLIQIGLNTHSQLHVMTPQSFNAINKRVSASANPMLTLVSVFFSISFSLITERCKYLHRSLISIFRIVVLIPGFDRMMPMAQRLPVLLIPEQFLISTVRDDMIYIGRLHVSAFLHALHTKRMGFQIFLSGFLPSAVVSSPCRTPVFFRVEALMLFAILRPIRNESRTTGMAAGSFAPIRHSVPSFHLDI